MTRTCAVEVKAAALQAVQELLGLLEPMQSGCGAEEYARLHREVGLLVGNIQVGILDGVYEQYPDLSDLQ